MTHPAVTEAREWVGTPYRDRQSAKGVGCDCLGLLRGVYLAVTGTEPEAPPPYSPDWGEVRDDEPMLEAAARYLVPAVGLEPGNVLIFRIKRGRAAKHCAIVTENGFMVHADGGAGRVVECHITDAWRRRIAGVFTWQTS